MVAKVTQNVKIKANTNNPVSFFSRGYPSGGLDSMLDGLRKRFGSLISGKVSVVEEELADGPQELSTQEEQKKGAVEALLWHGASPGNAKRGSSSPSGSTTARPCC